MIVALEGVPVTSGTPIHDLLKSLDKQTQQVALVRSASTDEVNAKVTLGSPGSHLPYFLISACSRGSRVVLPRPRPNSGSSGAEAMARSDDMMGKWASAPAGTAGAIHEHISRDLP